MNPYSPIKEILTQIGLAVAREIVRLLDETGRQPLRANSTLRRQLLSGEAVKVSQGRGASGRFEGYTASSSLTLYALDYLQWVDSGRKKFAKKVPLSAILQFIKDRNLQPRNAKGRYVSPGRIKIKAKGDTPEKSLNKLAFLIQRSIYLHGIRPRPVIGPAFDLGQHLVELYLDNQLLDGMTMELEEQLKLSYISTKN